MTIRFLSCGGRSALVTAFTLMSFGCKLSDDGPSSHISPDQFFSDFALEHRAINLSTVNTYDTLTLKTIAMMADGSPVPGEVIYSVSNPAISITNGILKANSPISEAFVRVKLTHGTITRTDSARVSVISTNPVHLNEFGFQLPPDDSAKTAVASSKIITLIRQSESGSDMSGLKVSLRSSDTTVAQITQSESELSITASRPGRVMLYASTFAYGVEKRDSLLFTVGWPLMFQIPVFEKFKPGSTTKMLDFTYGDVTIGVGGCVVWINRNIELNIDMEFENPTDVAPPLTCEFPVIRDRTIGGNIAPYRTIPRDGTPAGNINFIFSSYSARSFSVPGVFPYVSSIHGVKGVVRVCDENNDTTCAPRRVGAWY